MLRVDRRHIGSTDRRARLAIQSVLDAIAMVVAWGARKQILWLRTKFVKNAHPTALPVMLQDSAPHVHRIRI